MDFEYVCFSPPGYLAWPFVLLLCGGALSLLYSLFIWWLARLNPGLRLPRVPPVALGGVIALSVCGLLANLASLAHWSAAEVPAVITSRFFKELVVSSGFAVVLALLAAAVWQFVAVRLARRPESPQSEPSGQGETQ